MIRRQAIIGLALLTPVLHLTAVGGANVNLCAADPLIGLGVLWLGWRFLTSGVRAPLLPLFCATIAVTVLSLVVNSEITFFARSPLGAAVAVLKGLFPWMYFYVAVSLIRTRLDLLPLLKAWVAGSAFLALTGVAGAVVYQVAGVENPFALYYRAHGTMGDANFFSMHLGVSFFLTVLYRRLAGGIWWAPAVMALQVMGMFFSASRSGMLGFGCGLLILLLLGAPLRWRLAAVSGMAALAALVVMAPERDSWLASNPFTARLATTTIDVGTTDRGKLWAAAFQNFFSAPVMGVGYENTPYVDLTPSARPTETHNTYLNMISETGLLGLLIYLAVLLFYPVALWRDLFRTNTAGRLPLLCLLAAFANVGAVGVPVNVENYRGLWILMALTYWFRVLYPRAEKCDAVTRLKLESVKP
jgi:O-antigen ligase